MKFENFALTWFMGAGKTSIWLWLAEKLWKDFIDVDDYILREWKTNGIEIGDFIVENWIDKFREIETQAIKEILWINPKVLALWWWAVTISQNVQILRDAHYGIIYLDYPFDILAERILKAEREWKKHRKPFVEDDFRKLYDSRQEIYKSTADIIIQNNLWELQDAINLILEAIK